MFHKILIANRGEIAMRVIRACRELDIRTVAIHSDVDATALHVRFADEAVCVGPAPARQSYLNVPAVIAAAEITGATAVHPGYGFLAESANFAEICRQTGLVFIGPEPEAMRAWGDKVSARAIASAFGLPLLAGSEELRDAGDALHQAARIGYPVILKAAGGGGGRGMRVVRSPAKLEDSFLAAHSEANAAFASPNLYLERFIEEPRHIEFQIIADRHGGVWVLGERECSLQRRHQKLVEEAPSPSISPDLRSSMSEIIRRAIRETGYTSLGTLEFLMDADGQLYFLETNTRVQVEHPVTELVTGVDLLTEQIRIAAGLRGDLPDTRAWRFRGHAVECRINAEHPTTFAPQPGTITEFHPPGGAGIRVDAGVYGGWTVPPHYDSLLAKVIAHGQTRSKAHRRMLTALDEFVVSGVATNIPLHKALLRDLEVVEGRMTTRTVERVVGRMLG